MEGAPAEKSVSGGRDGRLHWKLLRATECPRGLAVCMMLGKTGELEGTGKHRKCVGYFPEKF